LPDPRDAAGVSNHPLQTAASGDDAALQAALRDALAAGDDAAIRAALGARPPARAQRVARSLAAALDGAGEGIGLRFFAIPLVTVAGSRGPATVPGALPEVGKIAALLEQHGAVGVTRNFGLGNALVSAEALDALSPAALWRAAADPAQRPLDALRPGPIQVSGSREQVHLRFIAGAGITPRHLPSFLESASNIGTWGMAMTKELARQLAQPGLEILPMPRPPQPLLTAAHAGRRAQLEAALSLFLGNTLRKFRMAVGDPEAVLSSHRLDGDAGELRLSLSTPIDDSLFEGFAWPLQPQDETAEVTALFQAALADCRVTNATLLDRVLPDRLPGGSVFIAGRMLEGLGREPAKH
ncbi:MAG: hypothetical protein KF834_10320, partial [Burkholderiales bacterium]|nr:hypothetical protein [Burkholderiales bacterium]